MFHSARLKLTTWYLLIIACILALFSLAIYSSTDREIERMEHNQQVRQERFEQFKEFLPDNINLPEPPMINYEITRNRLIFTLLLIDGGILLLAGGAGYFLAGRTLRPIQEMLEEQRRFVSDASHELRTPLTALRSEIEVNLREKNLSQTEVRALLESNLEEVISLQLLSDSLMRLTKHEALTQKSFTTLAVTEILEEAMKKVAALAKKKKIALTPKFADASVEGDRQSLVELFVILLDNAIKYSPDETEVTVASKPTDHAVKIEITDQGMGIDSLDMPHIFDRFYRADKSRARGDDPGGHGLGLSIAKQIVTEHNGTINVKSVSEKGTTFTVRLPQTAA